VVLAKAGKKGARSMIRVMIVEDDESYRRVLRIMAETVDGLEVVAEAGTAEEALAMIDGVKPDLVLMDVRLPGMSGLEGAERMRRVAPEAQIVLMSAEDRSDYRTFVTKGGAAAFVPKSDINPETLGEIVQKARPNPMKCEAEYE
jgi:DNA-binding NarL/FixJ family response regulator